ncbi:hypothetical protein ABFV83_08045 [Lacrimispora sp. BS-2]|uniref:Uncharacterized protein n=1 Tax=Lacrimispora sp. BS-2 TaxID=3151850 RepID=A0AAU7PU55_9FIRM
MLTPRCGENAVDVFNAADIKIFKTTNAPAKENIDAFIAGKLSLLDEIHAGFHSHGGKQCGVVLNKCLEGENPAENFCLERNIKILCRIPFDNELGMLNSNAKIAVRENEKYQAIFSSLLETVTKEVRHETIANP